MIQSFCSYIQGQESKYTRFYYPNGQISSEGPMINGKPDGYWITYYVTGIKKSEGKRKNFILDSTWVFYNQVGDTLEKINYKNGKKNGFYYKYAYNGNKPDGYIAIKELFVNDLREGTGTYYYADGKIRLTIPYKEGKKEGIAREYDREGNIITILEYHKNILINRQKVNRRNQENQKDGLWLEFYDDGKFRKEENYSNGLLDGYVREYDRNGNIKLVLYYKEGRLIDNNNVSNADSETMPVDIRNIYDKNGNLLESGPYKNNIPVGLHRFYKEGKIVNSVIYDNNGKKMSEGIVNEKGERVGTWKNFYPDGKLQSEGNYFSNSRNGQWKFYYPNGSVEQIGSYRNGRESGQWNWYYPNGTLHREENYFNGKRDGPYVEYDENGKIIAQGQFLDGEKDGQWEIEVGDHKETGKYVLGLREGIWRYYYQNGKLRFEGNYTRGMANGKHKYYYQDGGIKEEQFYVMGLKEKTWKKFDESGNLYLTITYKNDVERRINGVRIKLEKEVKTIR